MHVLLVPAVSTELSQGCAKGCDLCSEFNGCLKCSPKLFILLERNDIRQIGICLPSCPLGYFGLRNPDMNKCISKCLGLRWGVGTTCAGQLLVGSSPALHRGWSEQCSPRGWGTSASWCPVG